MSPARQLTLTQSEAPTSAAQVCWRLHGARQSVLVGEFNTPSTQPRAQGVLALDLDGTLIQPKSGRKYPKDINDWSWMYGGPKGTLIKDKLQKWHSDGFCVCVLSNQKFTPAQKSREAHAKSLEEKLTKVFASVSFPLSVYCALGDDEFRKPRTGFLKLMPSAGSRNIYVGDAAGRQKDHSACDYQWALNANWEFMTPEMFFLNRQRDFPLVFDFDPRCLLREDCPTLPDLISAKVASAPSPALFMLVGPPGAGKSFLARTVFRTCKWMNQDTIKDKARLMKLLKQHLSEKQSVVIDRMNYSVAQRAPFLAEAQQHGVPCVCIYLNISRAFAQHANVFRMLCNTSVEHRDGTVPTLTYNLYYKELAEPTEAEGFSQIITVTSGDFSAGPFESVAASQLFYQFLR